MHPAEPAADEFRALGVFRDDSVWATAHGKRLTGRDEIAAFTANVLPGATAHSTATYDLVHVVVVRDDVAVLHVCQRPLAPSGDPLPDEPDGSPSYVVVREPDGWHIVAGQNPKVLA